MNDMNKEKNPIEENEYSGCLTLVIAFSTFISLVVAMVSHYAFDKSFLKTLIISWLIIFVPLCSMFQYCNKSGEKEKNNELEEAIRKEREKMRKKEIRKKARKYIMESELGLSYKEESRRPAIPKEVMEFVYNRDDGRCQECGAMEDLEFDHIIPYSKGGADSIDNLRLLCRSCNARRGNNFK